MGDAEMDRALKEMQEAVERLGVSTDRNIRLLNIAGVMLVVAMILAWLHG